MKQRFLQNKFQGSATIYNNPELEMLAKEIQALLSEKLSLEKELQVRKFFILKVPITAHKGNVSRDYRFNFPQYF